jgi:hypothetical protein
MLRLLLARVGARESREKRPSYTWPYARKQHSQQLVGTGRVRLPVSRTIDTTGETKMMPVRACE